MQDRISRERLGLNSYESQPLAALAKSSSFAAKCNIDIVPSPVPNQLPSPRFKFHTWLTLLSISSFDGHACCPASHLPRRRSRCPREARWREELITLGMGKFQPQDHPELWALSLQCPSGRGWRTGGDLAKLIVVSAVLTTVGETQLKS